MRKKANKYKAKKCKIDGYTFDSLMEGRRYNELKLLNQSGRIDGIFVHPAFSIFIKEVFICKVILDFGYFDNDKLDTVYEDVKGCKTALSSLKKKLVEAQYSITVTLITKVK